VERHEGDIRVWSRQGAQGSGRRSPCFFPSGKRRKQMEKTPSGQDGRFRCVIDIDPNSGVQDHRADMPGGFVGNRSAPAARRNFFRSASRIALRSILGYFPSLLREEIRSSIYMLFDMNRESYAASGSMGLSLPSVERRRLRNCQIPMGCRRPSRPRRRRGAGWTICRVPLTKADDAATVEDGEPGHKRVAEGACRCVDAMKRLNGTRARRKPG